MLAVAQANESTSTATAAFVFFVQNRHVLDRYLIESTQSVTENICGTCPLNEELFPE